MISILYGVNIPYYTMLNNLNDPVHVFNQVVASYSIEFDRCPEGKIVVDCYDGYVNYIYGAVFEYENITYHTTFNNSIKVITSNDDTIDTIQTYLEQNYPLGSLTTANVNICHIDSYYNSICTTADQQLPGLFQPWLTPPVDDAYDAMKSLELGLIVYTSCFFIGIFIILIFVCRKHYN